MKDPKKSWKAPLLLKLKATREASVKAAQLSSKTKKKILQDAARELVKNSKIILRNNKNDPDGHAHF